MRRFAAHPPELRLNDQCSVLFNRNEQLCCCLCNSKNVWCLVLVLLRLVMFLPMSLGFQFTTFWQQRVARKALQGEHTIDDIQITNTLAWHKRVGLCQAIPIRKKHSQATFHNNKDATGTIITSVKKNAVRFQSQGCSCFSHFPGVIKLQACKKFCRQEELWDIKTACR